MSDRDDSLETELKVYETFRQYVEHEDSLINNRMTWMLTIHGFLYATYGFTVQKKLEIIQKIDEAIKTLPYQTDFATYVGSGQLRMALLQLELVLILVAVVGMAISGSAAGSIHAARKSLQNVQYIFWRRYPPTTINRADPDASRLSLFSFWLSGDSGSSVKVVELGRKKPANLPWIAGGGSDETVKRGIGAAVNIPYWLIGGWFVAFCWSIWYVFANIRIFSKDLIFGFI